MKSIELSFNELKKKNVISVSDGKQLGKIVDVTICYPENSIKGYTVSSGGCFKFPKEDKFVPVSSIVKVGEDVILVDISEKKDKKPPCPKPCPSPCPDPCAVHSESVCKMETSFSQDSRRSYDEYE